jgi:protocatechuate 3,4-dioxygenase beta subunit
MGGRTVRMNRGGRTINDEGQSQGTTNAEGNVVLSSFPGKQATLKVKHADYALWQDSALKLAESSDHQATVKLARGGEVLVTVQDSKGQPVAGVEIEHAAQGDDEQNPWMRRFSGEGSSRTDARGELSFAHLAPGTHRFRLGGSGGPMGVFGGGGSVRATFVVQGAQAESAPEEPWTSVEVLEGAQAPLKLIAPMRGTVTGRVREGGKALAGASVRLDEQRSGEPGLQGLPFFGGGDGPRTNGSGEYKQEGVKPGKYDVHVSHPSRAMEWKGELEVTEGEQRYDIDLPIAIVEGRVLAPDGKPIAGARISAERAQEKVEQRDMVFSVAIAGDSGDVMSFGGSGGGETVRSDADGRYTLRGLLTDTDLVVHVTGKDFTPANSEKFRCAPDQTVRGIDVHPKQGGSLEVRVLRAGQPATGVLVNAYHKGKDGTQDSQQSEMSGAGGIARFHGLEPGEWEYTATDFSADSPDPGNGAQESPRKPVQIKPGETTKDDHELH